MEIWAALATALSNLFKSKHKKSAVPKKSQHNTVTTEGSSKVQIGIQGAGATVQGDVIQGDKVTGITFEQYAAWQQARENALQSKLAQLNHAAGRHEAECAALQAALRQIEKDKSDEQASYQKYIQELQTQIDRLQTLIGKVPQALLEEAKQALAGGETEQANALFEQIKAQTTSAIEIAAEVEYQQGLLAENNLDYGTAYAHLQRAVQLAPQNTTYLNASRRLAHVHTRVDSLWLKASFHADMIGFLFTCLGMTFALLSHFFWIDSVYFNGVLKEGNSIDILNPYNKELPEQLEKQVGDIWRFTWPFISIILLPFAIIHSLKARNSIEVLLKDFFNGKMKTLVSKNIEKVSLYQKRWRAISVEYTRISVITCALFFLVFLVNLFQDENISQFKNSLPSIFSYLYPLIISGGLISGTFWFFSFGEFLKREEIAILPDMYSHDNRVGYERFELVFQNLILACFYMILMGWLMHMQNVFLRSPNSEDIFDFLFKVPAESIENASAGEIVSITLELVTKPQSMSDVMLSSDYITLQSMIGPFLMIIVPMFVIASFWGQLKESAKRGIEIRRREINNLDEAVRLSNAQIWPINWLSLEEFRILMIVMFVSLYYVNFTYLIIAYVLLKILGSAVQMLKQALYKLI